MSRRHTVHSGADLRLLAWAAAETDNGQDRMVQRKDRYGYPIRWEDYEDEESQFEWFTEAIDPEKRRIAANIRPVSFRGRQPKGGREADTDGVWGRSDRLAAVCRAKSQSFPARSPCHGPANPSRARRKWPLEAS